MLNEIRKQPHHIRALFMWLSVFIVFSAIVFVWVSSFEQKLAFMLDGEPDGALAEVTSPFAVIGSSAGDLKAAVLGIFGVESVNERESVFKGMQEKAEQKIKPRLLPVSD